MSKVGFIMLRCVKSKESDNLWGISYDCIRKFYPENHILIIDDNSNKEFLTTGRPLYNTTIINSEYTGRGELLPYYYYLHNKLFDIAVIIHDSVFMNMYIDFSSMQTYRSIWCARHLWDQIDDESKMIGVFNNQKLTDFYNNKDLWRVCFGGMAVIRHDYLKTVNDMFNIELLLPHVINRYNRMSFERVIGALLQFQSQSQDQKAVFGDIHDYCKWGGGLCRLPHYMHLPIVKIWNGR